MSTEIAAPAASNSTALVEGIIGDVKTLTEQKLQLARAEIMGEVGRTAMAVATLSVGAAVVLVGIAFFGLSAAGLLHAATSPSGADPASLPLWACLGLVGAAFSAAGLAPAWVGGQMLRGASAAS